MEIFAYENRGICFAGCADHFFSKDKIRTVIVFVIRKKNLDFADQLLQNYLLCENLKYQHWSNGIL